MNTQEQQFYLVTFPKGKMHLQYEEEDEKTLCGKDVGLYSEFSDFPFSGYTRNWPGCKHCLRMYKEL